MIDADRLHDVLADYLLENEPDPDDTADERITAMCVCEAIRTCIDYLEAMPTVYTAEVNAEAMRARCGT